MMRNSVTPLQFTDNGVLFTMDDGIKQHECIVSTAALSYLSQLEDGEMDYSTIFFEFENKIKDVARQMLHNHKEDAALVLWTPAFYRQPEK